MRVKLIMAICTISAPEFKAFNMFCSPYFGGQSPCSIQVIKFKRVLSFIRVKINKIACLVKVTRMHAAIFVES